MTTRARTDQLTTVEMYNLDLACRVIHDAFGQPPYLVGTAGAGSESTYRDVDVRLMLDDDDFAAACPTRARWESLCLAFGAYLSERTGLPVDFQIQRTAEANERFGNKMRNPLGMGRTFAGGGDGTPEWARPPRPPPSPHPPACSWSCCASSGAAADATTSAGRPSTAGAARTAGRSRNGEADEPPAHCDHPRLS